MKYVWMCRSWSECRSTNTLSRGFVDHCQPPNSWYGEEKTSAAVFPGQYDFETFVQKNESFQKFVASLKN